MASNSFKELLKPGRIGTLQLKNRIVMAPMGTYLAGRDGLVTERLVRYYEARARGGAGLLIAGVASVDYPRGRVMTRQVAISDDKFIPGLSELAQAIHQHGAAIGIQLQHGGRIAAPFLSGGNEAVGPSVIPLVPQELGVTRQLTVAEIEQLVQRFAEAADRAKRAGLDGVEIHAGHGYLIGEFLSRQTNSRQDEYGGSLENRAKFLIDIIASIRSRVGRDYPVLCRLDGREFGFENGITPQEAQQVAVMAEKASLDAIHVSGYGGSEGTGFTVAPLVYQAGCLAPLARDIKQKITIPVIGVGRISPEMGEQLVRAGAVDFVAMGRQLLADPETPNKLAAGQASEIRRCIYCYSCVHQIFVRSNVCCAINPAVGKESEPAPSPAGQVKKVLVVGGGTAGLEAALTAAQRGHQVELHEKGRNLGGSLQFAAILRPENQYLTDYFINEIRRSTIQVKLGSQMTADLIARAKPDAVVIACGAKHIRPEIPGIDGPNVIDGDDLRRMLSGGRGGRMNAGSAAILRIGSSFLKYFPQAALVRRLTYLWMPLGRRVAILGAGLVGLELALFLAERRRQVTLLETSDQLAPEMALPMKWKILDELKSRAVPVLCEVKYQRIDPRAVEVLMKDGSQRLIAADTVIIASGAGPNQALFQALQGRVPEVYLAGDCNKLSYIKDSIADGCKVGSSL